MKPYTKKDFAWVNWTPAKIDQVAQAALKEQEQAYKTIKKIKATDRNFENTILALEGHDRQVNSIVSRIVALMNASPKKAVREAAALALDKMNKRFVDLIYDKEIYQAVEDVGKQKIVLKEEDEKLYKDTKRDLKRLGLGLSKNKRDQLKNLQKKLNTLSIKFDKNIADHHDFITLEENETDGLPQEYLDGLEKDDKGRYKVTLQYPDIGPFMDYATNASKRRELLEKNMQKGGRENIKILQQIVELRDKIAKTLGYKDHAEFAIEVKTAKTPKVVNQFVSSLLNKLQPALKKDIESLVRAKRKDLKDERANLEVEDIAFYGYKIRKAKLKLDDEKVKEYFPIEKVKEGTFQIYSKLLSVKFKELKGYPLWHEDAKMYLVEDKDGSPIAHFILDLYPREGKYSHAAVFDVEPGREVDGKYIKPVGCMLTNFSKPSPKRPSLLYYGEVRTFFHEFGHLMHVCLTKAKYPSQSGANTAWDFVEAPSQMLEYWLRDEKILGILSSHYKTGRKMPKSMMQNLIASHKHLRAYGAARQLSFALFDMKLHTQKIKDIPKLYDDIVKDTFNLENPKGNIWPAGFGHMIGYSAGYYGYMWSRVFAADMFTRFKKEGLLNSKTGADYRTWILEKGSSVEELKLVEKFLGRKPNNKAFLKELGV